MTELEQDRSILWLQPAGGRHDRSLTESLGTSADVWIPFDPPSEFKEFVTAAVQSYAFGYESIDYFKKRYVVGREFKRPPKFRRELAKFLNNGMREARAVANSICVGRGDVLDDTLRSHANFCADACLIRLATSIKSAAAQLNEGYVYEAAALLRIVAEQSAWAYSVYDAEDSEVEKYLPTKCISKVKDVCDDAGLRYGLLSDYTHINPRRQKDFVEIDDNTGLANVTIQDFKLSLEIAVLFGYLVDDYRVVAERVAYDSFVVPEAWGKIDGVLHKILERPFLTSVLDFEKRVKEQSIFNNI